MQLIRREDLEQVQLPGRVIQKVVGKDGFSRSARMTAGFARHSGESGHEPHHHAEELVYIISSRDGWVRYGPSPDRLGPPLALEAGMILHFPELEWHVFEFGVDGLLEIIYFYGQVDNIRPEEIAKSQESLPR